MLSDELCEMIVTCVEAQGYTLEEYKYENELFLKIDLLERLLELLRIRNRCLENKLPIELFIQGDVKITNCGFHFIPPHKTQPYKSGTPPIQLQPKLLLFLFFQNFRGEMRVYDVINNFITLIWDKLDPLDFKKTRTGVTRCFTNTKFAANTLRAYGLLKFTRREAYKTWVLSLPGILVGAELASKQSWSLKAVEKGYPYELHPDIGDTFTILTSYNNFVTRLLAICKPGTKVFNEFKNGSQRSYSLLNDYWGVMWNPEFKKEERRKKSLAYLKRIEQDPEIRSFYEEFIRCVKVGELLSAR